MVVFCEVSHPRCGVSKSEEGVSSSWIQMQLPWADQAVVCMLSLEGEGITPLVPLESEVLPHER